MSKSLVMGFINEAGTKATIRLDEIRENITEAEIETVMDLIIGKNILKSTGGDLVARDSAQIVEKIVAEYDVK